MTTFDSLWINTLNEMRGSYACTNPSVEIDLDAFLDENVNPINFSLNIILVNGLLFLLTMVQFCCHYKLMMSWFLDNPKDGRLFARKIQVGIPLN